MKIIWALFICAQLGKYKKEDFLTKDLYPAELNAHLYRVLNCVAQQQNQVYIRKNNMSSIKMKKVQKILTSFLHGAIKAGLLVLIRDKDRSDSIW